MRAAVARAVVVVLVAGTVAATVPAGAVHESGDRLTVRLEADGDAEVIVEETFDLSVDEERAAFQRLEENATAREQRRERFADRLREAATAAGEATDREMAVSDPSIEVARTGEGTGVLRLRARWTNLAAVESGEDGRALVVTEPFAGGFEMNRTLAVRGPDGFTRAGASPRPQVARKNVAMWGPGEDLDGFEARFVGSSDQETDAGEDAGGDGGETDAGSDGQDPTATPIPSDTGAFLAAAAVALLPATLVALALRHVR